MRAHPFAVAADDVVELLDLSARLPGAVAELDTAVLALPTRGPGPVPPPELAVVGQGFEDVFSEDGGVDGEPESPVSVGLWRVPALRFDADSALALLPTLTTDWAPEFVDGGGAPGFGGDVDAPVFGGDVHLLRELAEFAKDLTARGRVLPTVREGGTAGQAESRWRPLITGPDATWLRTFPAALPPSLFASVDSNGKPVAGPTETVASAVDALVDAAVRAALDPAPRRRGRRSWRSALVGTDRLFAASPDEVAGLRRALDDWQRDAIVSGAVRACFRLVEPEEPDSAEDEGESADPLASADSGAGVGAAGVVDVEPGWCLEFALQAADEPSLIVDASRIWRARGSMRALARHVPEPQETLLAELGRAVRLYPELSPALRTAKPSGLPLDTIGAHAFLAEAAPTLLAAGFGVVLPGWWTNPSRLGTRLRATTPAQPGAVGSQATIGQEGLIDFDWQLAVGDEPVTDSEIDRLIRDQQPLVRLRGQWMLVDAEKLRRARGFLRRQQRSSETMTVIDVFHALGSGTDGPGGLPLLGVDADGWLGDLLSEAADRRVEPVPTPPSFRGTLRPYQERGLAWLTFLESIGMGGLLADDMGLGKTIQLLALIARDAPREGNRAADADVAGRALPTLLVCPMSLVGNWEREAARFTPDLRVHVHHGAERSRGEAFEQAVAQSDLVVTTYSLLARDAAALREIGWRRIVLDEAQAVKNAATKAAAAARSMPASNRIAVTGTPVENRLADLWSLMEFANPRLLGNASDFKNRFATPIEKHGDAEAGRRLRALTQPFVLRRLKTDRSIITDLPEKLEMEVVCSLTGEQAALYQGVVADMLEQIDKKEGMQRRGLVLATMTKLKQVCNHPAQFLRDGSRVAGRSGKLARLEETLDEVLAAGEQAIIFSQYAEFGAMVRGHLTARFGREVAFLHGGVGRPERDAMVARFQGDGRDRPPLMVLSLKAGGTGLTLTAANHVIHVDRWWNPAVEDQATDRAFRIGQTRSVQVRKFVCAGTLEEKIAAMIQDKRGLAASIVGTGEGWLTELSTAQLRELVRLEPGAVVE
ncbi:MAG: DEAD/DEAH box helicase [Candidatus Nanopelagicales bacterium]|nr:DEAD/DEAH box helicase [Candidatus Nanopelagicales bacterium]MDZ4249189.1 DEAD/DEAH box helicase [Candidatus Nanopelagicales bacterium]